MFRGPKKESRHPAASCPRGARTTRSDRIRNEQLGHFGRRGATRDGARPTLRSRQQSSRRVRRTACSPHACWSICTLALSRTRPGARSTLSLGLANAAHARTHALTNARAHTHTHTHTHTKRIAGPRPSPLPPPSPPRTSLQAARAATEEPRARSSRRVRRTACSPHACWSICTLGPFPHAA